MFVVYSVVCAMQVLWAFKVLSNQYILSFSPWETAMQNHYPVNLHIKDSLKFKTFPSYQWLGFLRGESKFREIDI